RGESAKRRMAPFFDHSVCCKVELFGGGAHLWVVVVHRAVEAIICLVTAPYILHVSAVRIGPGIESGPTGSHVAPRDLDNRDESVRVQIVNFSVQILEIAWIETFDIGVPLLITGHFAWKEERPATLVRHVLGSPLVTRTLISYFGLIDPGRAHAK